MKRKEDEDKFREKVVLFVTKGQKIKLHKHCKANKSTMSGWLRKLIDGLT